MLLVDAIDLGLHLGMPALDYDREFADQPSRAKPVEQNFLAGRLAKASAAAVSASLRGARRALHSP